MRKTIAWNFYTHIEFFIQIFTFYIYLIIKIFINLFLIKICDIILIGTIIWNMESILNVVTSLKHIHI